MKKLTTAITVILLSAGAGTAFYSCNTNAYSVSETVMLDKTDSFLAVPDSTAVRNSFHTSTDLWQGYEFRLLMLSDVDFNSVHEANLAPACEYISNYYDRTDESKMFLLKIDSAFEKVKSVPSGRNYSSLYLPIAVELKRLSESTAKRRILVVYSDLMENTSLISFYKSEKFQLIKTNPNSVRRILESEIPMPDLKGIEVYLIYQPQNNYDSELFREVSGFYKKWLESKGAKVNIGANLIL
ncbi:MAG: hypothetical protein HY840_08820 [Bacteroidetes bacterium]|nr:hypothetical protein [Bacteroidota bacterium]